MKLFYKIQVKIASAQAIFLHLYNSEKTHEVVKIENTNNNFYLMK